MRDLSEGAFILTPAFVKRSLSCAYPLDAHTQTVPWAHHGCRRTGAVGPTKEPKALPKVELERAMNLQVEYNQKRNCRMGLWWPDACYNEMIFEVDGPNGWYQHLPDAIEAWVVDPREHDNLKAITREHGFFIEHFGVKPGQIPLVKFDNQRLDSPISLP